MQPALYQDDQDQLEDLYDMEQVYSSGGWIDHYTGQSLHEGQQYVQREPSDAYGTEESYEDGVPVGTGSRPNSTYGHNASAGTGGYDVILPGDDTARDEYDPEDPEDTLIQYGMDPDQGWDMFEDVDGLLEPDDTYDVTIDADNPADRETAYDTELDEAFYEQLLEDGPHVYGTAVEGEHGDRYVEIVEVAAYSDEDEDQDVPAYQDLPVVEHEMRDGLFGFVDPTANHPVAHVNKALYRVDKQRTRRHEASRASGHPSDWAADELMIRYKNGDIDVQNTLSFQAGNVSRIQHVETGYMPWAEQYDTPASPMAMYTDSSAQYADV